MRNIDRNIIRILLYAAAMALMESCGVIYDNPDDPSDTADNLVSVEFSVPKAGGGATTDEGLKWGDIYNSALGTSYDSYIDPALLRLAVYDTAGNYKGEVEKIFFVPVGSTTDSQRYNYLGKLPDGLDGTTTYRVMAFANAPGYETAETYATAGGNFNLSQLQPDKGIVPMWGVVSTKFNLGYQTKLDEDLTLLRAVSKTYVRLDDASFADGYRLTSVTLSLPVGEGNIVPSEWRTVSKTKDVFFRGDYSKTFAPASNPVTTGTAMTQPFYKMDDPNLWVVYTPEYRNSKGDAKISFTLTKNGEPFTIDGEPFELLYRDYTAQSVENSYFDIARNHVYSYIVSIKETSAEITVNSIRIEDWVDDGGGILTPVQ